MAEANDSKPTPPIDREELEKRIGQIIQGKWTLERLIGAGGMAAVYAAKHEIGRKEAIKILHPAVARQKELVARFKREAHAVNRFSHPGAVEIRDIDETEDGEPFLVMELLDGQSLARKLKAGPLEPREALRLIDELLDVLVAAHDEDVIHRDIKPSNLFVEPDGKLKVLDFGVARLKHAPGTLVTDAGTAVGTIAYMPPEQLRGEDIDRRADLYAVGATLFRLVSGEKVHESEEEEELARQILRGPARTLTDVKLDAEEGLQRVVDRALAHVVGRRYPDARTMQTDVRALIAGEPPPYATERLAAEDDPRSLEAVEDDDDDAETAKAPDVVAVAGDDAAADDAAAGDAAQGGAGDTSPDEDGLTVKRPAAATVSKTLVDDEDETAPRRAKVDIDEEAPTRVRAPRAAAAGRAGKTEIADSAEDGPTQVKKASRPFADDTPAPRSLSQLEPERGGSGLLWVLLLVLVGGGLVFLLRQREDESLPPPIDLEPPTSAASAAAPPRPSVSASPSSSQAPSALPSGEPSPAPSSPPSATPSGQPRPSPGAKPPPPPILPSALPTLPSAWPTAIPSTLPWPPTTLPSALRPPTPPTPAPAPAPAPAQPDSPYE